MRQLLKTRLVDMNLSVRALNCLKAADVETLGDLVQYNKTDLLKFRNFGKKSLTELDDLLESLNLSFGTDISKYKLDKDIIVKPIGKRGNFRKQQIKKTADRGQNINHDADDRQPFARLSAIRFFHPGTPFSSLRRQTGKID